MAYLTQVKVKNKRYVYLTEYIGIRKYITKREKNIYSFGTMQNALLNMRIWQKVPDLFPHDLKEMGYGQKDLIEWVRTLETGKSKTGRSEKFKVN